MAHALAGTKVRTEDLVDLTALCNAYYEVVPSVEVAGQKVSFGTSGHRGISTAGSFNDLHVAAITQAVCDGRKEFGAEGPCFVGHDTHALSAPALDTVLEVLAGNGVVACVDSENGFVPTPSVSRAIIRYNEAHDVKADGLIITPSHNPPDNGGIKYNPTNGGPADTSITGWIEAKANEYLAAKGAGIKRIKLEEIPADLQIEYDYKGLYVKELTEIIDIKAIQRLSRRCSSTPWAVAALRTGKPLAKRMI